jgi:hypothetical protein
LKKLLFILNFILSFHWAFAQRPDRHADNWLFGSGTSIQFPLGSEPGNSNVNNINTENAFMTYSDDSGNLVLYSNGNTVWNKSGNPIEGAENIIRAPNPVYPGLIIPIPENDNLFYVFSVDDFTGNNNGITVEFPIFYSKIDMSQNNGDGKRIENSLTLLNASSFGMTTVKHCNNIDYWLVIHKGSGNEFLSFLITKDGIDTSNSPISSKIGIPFIGSSKGLQQEIIASEDGKKLAITKPFHPEGGFVQIFDFDNKTGKITQLVTSYKNEGMIKGAAFSPDGNFIYVSKLKSQSQTANQTNYVYEVVQYRTFFAPAYREQITEQTYLGQTHASLGNFLVDPGTFGNLKLGPNGKIYLAHIDASFLSIIHEPNKSGVACNFEYGGFNLNGKIGKAQLPNIISPDYPQIEAKVVLTADSLSCNPTLRVELKNLKKENATFQWLLDGKELQDATSIELKTTASGQYEVRVKDNCQEIKSLKKAVKSNSKILPPISTPSIKYCQGEEVRPLFAEGEDIKWYADANLSIQLDSGLNYTPPLNSDVVNSTFYYVTQTQNNCESSPVKIQLDIIEAKPINIGDAVQKECFGVGKELILKPIENINDEIEWHYNGQLYSKEKSITVNNYGTYVIKYVDAFCPASDTLTIIDGCLNYYIANAFSPNGDGQNEVLVLEGNGEFEFDFEVLDRRGRVMFAIKNNFFNGQPLTLWDGNYRNSPAAIGLYQYTIETREVQDGSVKTEKKRGSILLLR